MRRAIIVAATIVGLGFIPFAAVVLLLAVLA